MASHLRLCFISKQPRLFLLPFRCSFRSQLIERILLSGYCQDVDRKPRCWGGGGGKGGRGRKRRRTTNETTMFMTMPKLQHERYTRDTQTQTIRKIRVELIVAEYWRDGNQLSECFDFCFFSNRQKERKRQRQKPKVWFAIFSIIQRVRNRNFQVLCALIFAVLLAACPHHLPRLTGRGLCVRVHVHRHPSSSVDENI